MRKKRVAIVGAGPIGIDAALAAADAGMDFTLFEAGHEVGVNLRRWGHVRLFTPWSMNLSPRMEARLDALPGAESECPTGRDVAERLLEPLAHEPDVRPHVRLGARVVAVSRAGLVKNDEIGTGRRVRHPFRLLVRASDGTESAEYADVVLDCTGTYGHPNPLGDGGIPAPGEEAAADLIVRDIPDVEGDPDRWAGKTVLLVGGGHSGQTAASDLASLAEVAEGTHVLWCLRDRSGRVESFLDDPLTGRAHLNESANEILRGSSDHVEVRTGVVVDAIEKRDQGLRVRLRSVGSNAQESFVDVDLVVSLTGFVGDPSIYRQLQVHECYATAGPMKLAAALLAHSGADCLEQTGHGIDALRNPEPDFFLLGSKSYGRNNTFLLGVGYEQVTDVFEALSIDITEPGNRKEEPAA